MFTSVLTRVYPTLKHDMIKLVQREIDSPQLVYLFSTIVSVDTGVEVPQLLGLLSRAKQYFTDIILPIVSGSSSASSAGLLSPPKPESQHNAFSDFGVKRGFLK